MPRISVQSRVKSSLAEGIFVERLGCVLAGLCSCLEQAGAASCGG